MQRRSIFKAFIVSPLLAFVGVKKIPINYELLRNCKEWVIRCSGSCPVSPIEEEDDPSKNKWWQQIKTDGEPPTSAEMKKIWDKIYYSCDRGDLIPMYGGKEHKKWKPKVVELPSELYSPDLESRMCSSIARKYSESVDKKILLDY